MKDENLRMINAWSPTKGDHAGKIVRVYRDENNKRKIDIVDHSWYFYVDAGEHSEKILKLLEKKYPIKWNAGKEYIRVYYPKKAYKSKKLQTLLLDLEEYKVQHYEADLGPMKRHFVDNPPEWLPFDQLNIGYFDIETDDSTGELIYEENSFTGFKRVKAIGRVLSIGMITNSGKEFFLHDKSEENLLKRFNNMLAGEEIDMLIGYNSLDFDKPYLLQRMVINKVPTGPLQNILHTDLYRRIQDFYRMDPTVRVELKSYSLNSVAKYFLDDKKVPFNGSVKELYDNDLKKLKEYNMQDCDLVKRLEESLGVAELTHKVMTRCGCRGSDWSSVKTLDNLLLVTANPNGIHFKTSPGYIHGAKDTSDMKFMGGYVLDPEPGYYENVYVFDFASLYPNIIRTFNISPDTLLGKGSKEGCINSPGSIDPKIGELRGQSHFRSDRDGAFTIAIRKLLDDRAEIKKQIKSESDPNRIRDLNVNQKVVKEAANSIYGVMGNKYFRGFDIELVEAITGVGQYLLKHLKEKFEEWGHQVVYGDTDSIFFVPKGEKEIEEILNETNAYLKEHIEKEFNSHECTIQLGIDKRFDKFLIVAKKTYCGVKDGKTSYVGFDLIKRDTVEIAKRLQGRLIQLIFEEGIDAADAHEWIETQQNFILTKEYPVEDLVIYKKLSKDAEKYKAKSDKKYTKPLQVRIAERIKTDPSTGDDVTVGGSIIPYVIVPSESTSQDGVHISEFVGVWDREHYWNGIIYPKLERVLDAIFPDDDWSKFIIKHPKRSKNADTKRSSTKTRGSKQQTTDDEKSNE